MKKQKRVCTHFVNRNTTELYHTLCNMNTPFIAEYFMNWLEADLMIKTVVVLYRLWPSEQAVSHENRIDLP